MARDGGFESRGRANEALVEHLAKLLGVRRAGIRLVAGAGSRDKVVEVDGLTAAQVDSALG